MIDLATGKAVGTLALMRIDRANGVIEVGHVTYSPRLKRTRIATEAMFLLMKHVFDELGYRRFEWKCDSLNAPSRAAALRYGFTFEGIFRQAIVYHERNRDTAWFSIIDSEWPALRDGYTRWLDAGNFDAQGKQLERLVDLIAQRQRGSGWRLKSKAGSVSTRATSLPVTSAADASAGVPSLPRDRFRRCRPRAAADSRLALVRRASRSR